MSPPDGSIDGAPNGFASLDAFHRSVLDRVAELKALVAAVEAGDVTTGMRACAAAIAQVLGADARRHHEDEERHVFPTLLASGDSTLIQPVLVLQQDHHWLELDWRELEPHVAAIATGYGTLDIDVLREGAAILATLYQEHISLEESLVYPEARRRIGPGALGEMTREMLARRRAERRRRSSP